MRVIGCFVKNYTDESLGTITATLCLNAILFLKNTFFGKIFDYLHITAIRYNISESFTKLQLNRFSAVRKN